MTIVHLTPSFFPNRGGVETHVAAVSRVQQAAGHKVVVLTQPKPHSKLASWKFAVKLLPELLTADLIQVHDVFWWLLPVYPILAIYRKKIITTFHGWEGQYPVRWQAKLHRMLVSFLSTKSVHVGAWIQELYWDKPDAVVYGGAPKTTKTVTLSPWHKPLKITFVGRLESENEIELYLELIRLLQSKINCEVIWVGDGCYRKACAAVGKVTGMVDNVESYLVKADLVFASSYLSMLQAQAMGKLVVALYSHFLKQRYIETYPGYQALVSGSQSKLVVEQLLALVDKPKQLHALQQQAVWVGKEYTWEKVAQVYRQLAR